MTKCFIATSSEGQFCAMRFMDVLDSIFKISGLDIECILWREANEFKVLNDATLTRLISIGREEISYSIAFFTPDDLSTSRGQSEIVARDNVLFEYGLFLGILGEKRSFAVIPQDEDGRSSIKLPSDIGGISLPRYKFKGFDCTKYNQRDFLNSAICIVQAITGALQYPDPGSAQTTNELVKNPPKQSRITPPPQIDENTPQNSSFSSY